MLYFFQAGGMFMWLLLLILIIVLVLSVLRSIQLLSKVKNKKQLENGINSILFWGGYSVVVGFFAHFLGIMYAMEAIKAASDISPALVAGGYSVSLITILFGLIIFMISALVWFVLKTLVNRLDDVA